MEMSSQIFAMARKHLNHWPHASAGLASLKCNSKYHMVNTTPYQRPASGCLWDVSRKQGQNTQKSNLLCKFQLTAFSFDDEWSDFERKEKKLRQLC